MYDIQRNYFEINIKLYTAEVIYLFCMCIYQTGVIN